MDKTQQIKISKYLSKHLRHAPERLGLALAIGGWVNVDDLLSACAAHQFPITRAELEEVIATSDKQRFSFDETRTRIRANQGHSVAVDLELQSQIPPDVLYHGTGEQSVPAILQSGLARGRTQCAVGNCANAAASSRTLSGTSLSGTCPEQHSYFGDRNAYTAQQLAAV